MLQGGDLCRWREHVNFSCQGDVEFIPVEVSIVEPWGGIGAVGAEVEGADNGEMISNYRA